MGESKGMQEELSLRLISSPELGLSWANLNIHICQVNVCIYTLQPAHTYADVFGSVLENMPGI